MWGAVFSPLIQRHTNSQGHFLTWDATCLFAKLIDASSFVMPPIWVQKFEHMTSIITRWLPAKHHHHSLNVRDHKTISGIRATCPNHLNLRLWILFSRVPIPWFKSSSLHFLSFRDTTHILRKLILSALLNLSRSQILNLVSLIQVLCFYNPSLATNELIINSAISHTNTTKTYQQLFSLFHHPN
jgi:hypothetical protein